jgi:hypothetical protein
MTAAGPDVTARRRSRTALRDSMLNGDVRPGTGPNSAVSPEALTRLAHAAAATRGAPPVLSGDVADALRAATLPTAGPTTRATTTGNRPQPPPNAPRAMTATPAETGSSDASAGGSFASFASRQSAVFCSVAAGVGRVSSRIGWAEPPQPGLGGPWVSAWADVAHSPTRSVRRRELAAERGSSGIALLGE